MCMSSLPDAGQGWKKCKQTALVHLTYGCYTGSLCQGFSCIVRYCGWGQSAFNKCLLQGVGRLAFGHLAAVFRWVLHGDGSTWSWHSHTLHFKAPCSREHCKDALVSAFSGHFPCCWSIMVHSSSQCGLDLSALGLCQPLSQWQQHCRYSLKLGHYSRSFAALACLCGIGNPGFTQFVFECGIVKFAW